MTFAPKKAFAAAVLSLATIAGATATTTTTAQAGDEVVAGVIGFVAGTIVGSAVNQASQPQPIYHAQPVYVGGHLQPWTPAWYSSCSQRYRSFNPNTGYWLHVSGQYRFCQ